MKYILLYLPFVLAYLLQDTPTASYAASWFGSLFILWMSLSGRVKPLPEGRSLSLQFFRPIVFAQIVFASYTVLSSIFYFRALSRGKLVANSMGWTATLPLAAEAQSYYVLAHAAVVTGMLIAMNYSDTGQYRLVARVGANRLLLILAAGFFIVAQVTGLIGPLRELTLRLGQIAIVASVFSFALSLIRREGTLVWVNAAVFGVNLLSALMSGWKEEVLALMLLFLVALFPYYRRATLIAGAIALGVFVAVMPAYSNAYRTLAWYGNTSGEDAVKLAYHQVMTGAVDMGEATEQFAIGRVSEIGLFVGYLLKIPDERPFYGLKLAEQAVTNLIPRIVWSDKPNTERLVMERVYDNEIYSRASRISAKPQYVVDAYLSAGVAGILIAGVIYGALASLISRIAERWFGGYTMGSGLIFASLFHIFWRGNSFEFFFGTIFWSFLLMFALFQAGRRFGILVRIPDAVRRSPTYGALVPTRPLLPRAKRYDPAT